MEYLFFCIIIPPFSIIPESPRWLLVSGNPAEARRVLECIAAGNGTSMPKGELKSGMVGSTEKPSMKDLFTKRIVRHRTLRLLLIW